MRYLSRFKSVWFAIVALALAVSVTSPWHGGEASRTRFELPIAQAHAQDLKPPQIAEKSSAEPGQAGEKTPRGSQKKSEKKTISAFSMAMSALAGLVLFFYGVTRLAEGLGELNTERMRKVMAKFTTNRFAGLGTGIVATTLLESSSVTIIMVIAMVSGGVLSFAQSLSVVLGANIGTTVGAQIIALDVERYVPVLMLTGLLLLFLGKSNTLKKLGTIVLGFGLMFYGLEAIDEAMKPLRDHEAFVDAMRRLGEVPLYGAAVGALFTVAIQSSSATVAVVITLAGSGMISLPAGVAIMLGAEIGTCADTLVATVGRGRPALRTGVFHLAFNLATGIVGILLAPQLVGLVQWLSGGASVGRQIANAQILFNVMGVALVLPVLPAVARSLERFIPDAAAKPKHAADPMPAS